MNRGEESLLDLRHFSGLSRADVVKGVDVKNLGTELELTVDALASAELGCAIEARGWNDAEALGGLVLALGGLYRVPMRVVLDAWMRTRPDDVIPSVTNTARPGPSKAAMATWGSLNERQRSYLEEIFAEERTVEEEQRQARARGVREPARGLRRLTLAYRGQAEGLGHTRLQERLIGRGILDPGAGATVHALAKRDLVTVTEEELQHPLGGTILRVGVELTRRGRAAVRAGTGTPRVAQPSHLLSEWLWSVVARVAVAEPEGLAENDLAGRSLFYIGVGYQHRAGGAPSRGLIDAVPLQAPGGTHVLEYRWHLTSLGRRHVAAFLADYRDRYPGVGTTGLDKIGDREQ